MGLVLMSVSLLKTLSLEERRMTHIPDTNREAGKLWRYKHGIRLTTTRLDYDPVTRPLRIDKVSDLSLQRMGAVETGSHCHLSFHRALDVSISSLLMTGVSPFGMVRSSFYLCAMYAFT